MDPFEHSIRSPLPHWIKEEIYKWMLFGNLEFKENNRNSSKRIHILVFFDATSQRPDTMGCNDHECPEVNQAPYCRFNSGPCTCSAYVGWT